GRVDGARTNPTQVPGDRMEPSNRSDPDKVVGAEHGGRGPAEPGAEGDLAGSRSAAAVAVAAGTDSETSSPGAARTAPSRARPLAGSTAMVAPPERQGEARW